MTDPAAEIIAARPELGELGDELGGGLSDSRVHELHKNAQRYVFKVQRDPVEYNFYTRIALRHLSDRSWLPQVVAHGEWDGWNWVVLEHIPVPWPRDRVNFDGPALAILRELHETELCMQRDWLADHTWTRDQLAIAKRQLPSATGRQLDSIFNEYERRRSARQAPCSGDPNAPNWLVRQHGGPVLIDWQQVTVDHPALDVAGWLATMLTFDEIVRVAGIYEHEPNRLEVIDFARDVFVFFCRRCATNFWRAETSPHPERWRAGIERMKQSLPGWLDRGIRESGVGSV